MKGQRSDLSDQPCGAARALGIVGDWWSLLIVRDALVGLERFGEFQKSLGLAKNILSARLKKLVEDGVLRLEPDERAPARSKYVLTDSGRQLGVVVMALFQWGSDHCFARDEQNLFLVDKATGLPLANLQLKTVDGRAVSQIGFDLRDGAGRAVTPPGLSRP